MKGGDPGWGKLRPFEEKCNVNVIESNKSRGLIGDDASDKRREELDGAESPTTV